jgi:hypothetical protein
MGAWMGLAQSRSHAGLGAICLLDVGWNSGIWLGGPSEILLVLSSGFDLMEVSHALLNFLDFVRVKG